jgi:thiol-disulfide isomerase/thioredoxin
MFKHLFILLFVMAVGVSRAQVVRVVKFDAVAQLLKKENDTTYILNFWATWCKPCVHELPNFEKLDSMYPGKKMKLIFISLDFVKDIKKLELFAARKLPNQTVWLLDDPDYNAWIDKVDPSWGGSIPATLVFNNKLKFKSFYEKELDLTTLNNYIKPYFSNK